ncbi:MAG TPA: cupin domain-containing protein [Candidatus Dormibacteraeota bacterium]
MGSLVGPNEGERVHWSEQGHDFCLKVSPKGGGSFSLTEATIPPGQGAGVHVHEQAEECWYILEGDYHLKVGDSDFSAGPGATILVPRGTPHGLTAGENGGRHLTVFAPAGCERAFIEIGNAQRQQRIGPTFWRELGERTGTRFNVGQQLPGAIQADAGHASGYVSRCEDIAAAGVGEVNNGLGSFLVTATSSSTSRPMLHAVLSLTEGGVAIAVSDAPRNTHLGSWSAKGDRIEVRLLAYQFDRNGNNTGYLQVDVAGQQRNDGIKADYTVSFIPVSGTTAIVDQGTLSGSRLPA